MQLAIYLPHFPAEGTPNNGTSVAIAGLAAGLAGNGVRTTVLCEGGARRSLNGARGYAVECFEHRAARGRFSLAPGLADYVAGPLARERTLCLLNGMFHPGMYAMSRCLRRHGVRYVAVPHDPYDPAVFRRNAHLKWPYWYLFERRMLAQASAVQVLDARHGGCLRRLGLRTPVIETENGVDSERVPPESHLHWRASGSPVRLVFLGRLDAYNKGLDVLLEAFGRLPARGEARLTLQGPDWGDRGALERQARRAGIGEAVELLAPDYARSAPEILAAHDVFCLPSRFEGFGLAALEAMLAARVLLVSERAGIARHVEASGCGVAVAPTVHGVREGLDRLLQRRERWREMGLAGRRHALERLRWDRIAADLLHAYRALAS
jgi:glycosyltransferase involved in cell wall biosynthesis